MQSRNESRKTSFKFTMPSEDIKMHKSFHVARYIIPYAPHTHQPAILLKVKPLSLGLMATCCKEKSSIKIFWIESKKWSKMVKRIKLIFSW